MILYHFTALAHLIGEEGLVKARAASSSEGIDCGAFAAAGSILKSGLMPHQCGDYDRLLGEPMPACVWLTTNPDMSALFLNGNYLDHGNWRVTGHPEHRSATCSLDEILAAQAYFEMGGSELMRRENEGFYIYFGDVTRDGIRAVDHSDRADAARLARAA
jgi:hypothetical protein